MYIMSCFLHVAEATLVVLLSAYAQDASEFNTKESVSFC